MLKKTASFKQFILDVLFSQVRTTLSIIVVAFVSIVTLSLNYVAKEEGILANQGPLAVNLNQRSKVLGLSTQEGGDGPENFSILITVNTQTRVSEVNSKYIFTADGQRKEVKLDFVGLGKEPFLINLDTLPSRVAIIKQDYLLMAFVDGIWYKTTRIDKPEYAVEFENFPKDSILIHRALGAPELLY